MVNGKAKISVITPSLNSSDHIERAIKSVLKQDYDNWEHIVIDGGSTDGTVNLLKKYDHLNWQSEINNGQADAMNKGFIRSIGDVIVYLYSDAYFYPGAFSAIIKEFEKGSEFVVGNVLVKSSHLNAEFVNIPQISLKSMLRHWEENAFCVNSVGYFYLRRVQELCPFNTSNRASIDLEFLLDARSIFEFTKVDEILGCFEDKKESVTGRTQSRLDYWQPKTFPYIEKYLNGYSENDRLQYEIDRRKGYVNLQGHLNELNSANYDYGSKHSLPLISIIVPTYNCAPYVQRAIDSVLAQELADFEIIIVDDASTDNTLEILGKYSNISEIKIITHKKNTKQGQARNTGLDMAKGKYVFFLDADDFLEKGCISHLGNIAQIYKADIVACGSSSFWDNGITENFHSAAFACNGGLEALSYFSENYIGSIVWAKLFSRDLIERNHFRFNKNYFHEDVIFTMNSIYACKNYISINDKYYNYFQRQDSTCYSPPTLIHFNSYIMLYCEIVNFIKSNDIAHKPNGYSLAINLINTHWSNAVLPRIHRYIITQTLDEWARECREVCDEFWGENGRIFALPIIGLIAFSKRAYAKLGARSEELEDTKKELGARSDELETTKKELSARSEELETTKKLLNARSEELKASKSALTSMAKELSDIRSSLRWRAIQTLATYCTRIFPIGTLRRKMAISTIARLTK